MAPLSAGAALAAASQPKGFRKEASRPRPITATNRRRPQHREPTHLARLLKFISQIHSPLRRPVIQGTQGGVRRRAPLL
ncbi:hypothetical protein SKAU_G00358150 [Synaphobranchus kaupii]|uniref:Uncharacterized protein n=1 Tax=Synaphobranchus kaupii TaxID=118154 RepID=A0A9Q1IGT9_SYNKA|nr:hypothetical protein SKAU_G00358150 [Synaphobranchus kaupii]